MPTTSRRKPRRAARSAPEMNGNTPHNAPYSLPAIAPEHVEIIEHYSECHALGHDWQHFGRNVEAHVTPRFYGCYAMHSRCRECGTDRTKWLTRSGLSAGCTYNYPDHYLSRGEGKLERKDWGLLFIRSHLGDTPDPAPVRRARKRAA